MSMLRRSLFAAAAVIAVALALAAAPAAVAQVADADAADADHQALRDLLALCEKAVADDRVDLLRPHLHPEFTGVMVTGSPVAGYDDLAAYRARIQRLAGEGGRYTVAAEPGEPALVLGDTAIAHGTTRDLVTLASGGEYRFTAYWTAVLRKVDGRWLVYRIHGSMDPIDNPINAASGRRIAMLFGLIGAVAGSLIGWAFMAYRRRRA